MALQRMQARGRDPHRVTPAFPTVRRCSWTSGSMVLRDLLTATPECNVGDIALRRGFVF
jgi:hypothetical protein